MNNKVKQKYILYHDQSREVLFEGWYYSIRECVEHAVRKKIDLSGVDLRGQNLCNANMDEAKMTGANCAGANLNGANLSEGIFDHMDFSDADLSNACFVLSSLSNVNFYGASFGNTDMTDAIVMGCQFSCPSVFTTLFGRSAHFHDCHYTHDHRDYCALSRPPITVHGLARDIVVMDDAIKIGNDIIRKHDLLSKGRLYFSTLYGEDITAFLIPVFHEKMHVA